MQLGREEGKKGKISCLEARCAAQKSKQELASGHRGATVTSKVERNSSEGHSPCATQNTSGQAQLGSLASAQLPQDGFVPEHIAWSDPKFLHHVY